MAHLQLVHSPELDTVRAALHHQLTEILMQKILMVHPTSSPILEDNRPLLLSYAQEQLEIIRATIERMYAKLERAVLHASSPFIKGIDLLAHASMALAWKKRMMRLYTLYAFYQDQVRRLTNPHETIIIRLDQFFAFHHEGLLVPARS